MSASTVQNLLAQLKMLRKHTIDTYHRRRAKRKERVCSLLMKAMGKLMMEHWMETTEIAQMIMMIVQEKHLLMLMMIRLVDLRRRVENRLYFIATRD